jgi:hypothetical protein
MSDDGQIRLSSILPRPLSSTSGLLAATDKDFPTGAGNGLNFLPYELSSFLFQFRYLGKDQHLQAPIGCRGRMSFSLRPKNPE